MSAQPDSGVATVSQHSWVPFTRWGNIFLWPLAILTVIQRVIAACDGDVTDDFSPVYWAGVHFWRHQPVYTDDLSSVSPHYLYPPSGSLLFSPLAKIPLPLARYVFIIFSALVVIAAISILLHTFGQRWSSPCFPLSIFLAYMTEAVVHTLSFTNINACVLLAEVIFLKYFRAPEKNKRIIAGIFLGITFAIKPILAPLALLALITQSWLTLAVSITVPLVLNVIAWTQAVDTGTFVHNILPFLAKTRDFSNSALGGQFLYFGIAPSLTLFVKFAVLVITILGLFLLWKNYRNDEPFFSASFAGISLSALLLLSSLGQGYYSMFLFPVLATIGCKNSLVRNVPVWIGVFLCLSYGPFMYHSWPWVGRIISYWRITLGWLVILLSLSLILIFRALDPWFDRRSTKISPDPGPQGALTATEPQQ